jgi:hypothetical protein
MPVVHADILRCYVTLMFLLRVYTCGMIMYCEHLETKVWHVCGGRQTNA